MFYEHSMQKMGFTFSKQEPKITVFEKTFDQDHLFSLKLLLYKVTKRFNFGVN